MGCVQSCMLSEEQKVFISDVHERYFDVVSHSTLGTEQTIHTDRDHKLDVGSEVRITGASGEHSSAKVTAVPASDKFVVQNGADRPNKIVPLDVFQTRLPKNTQTEAFYTIAAVIFVIIGGALYSMEDIFGHWFFAFFPIFLWMAFQYPILLKLNRKSKIVGLKHKTGWWTLIPMGNVECFMDTVGQRRRYLDDAMCGEFGQGKVKNFAVVSQGNQSHQPHFVVKMNPGRGKSLVLTLDGKTIDDVHHRIEQQGIRFVYDSPQHATAAPTTLTSARRDDGGREGQL